VGIDRDPDGPETPADQMLGRLPGRAQGDVRVATAQAGQLVAHVELQLQVRMARRQLAEHRHHEAVEHGVGGRDPHPAGDAILARGQLRPCALQFRLDALGMRRELQCQVAGAVAASIALEQAPADALFDPLQGAEDGRGVHAQAQAGLGEGGCPGQGQHERQVVAAQSRGLRRCIHRLRPCVFQLRDCKSRLDANATPLSPRP